MSISRQDIPSPRRALTDSCRVIMQPQLYHRRTTPGGGKQNRRLNRTLVENGSDKMRTYRKQSFRTLFLSTMPHTRPDPVRIRLAPLYNTWGGSIIKLNS